MRFASRITLIYDTLPMLEIPSTASNLPRRTHVCVWHGDSLMHATIKHIVKQSNTSTFSTCWLTD